MALFTATEAPEKPERSPESSAASGANTSRSQRLSVPTLMPIPSFAQGDFQPYLPRSPVTLNSKMLSSVVPCDVPGSVRNLSDCAVTGPVPKMFHGTHAPPERQNGLAAVPPT